MTIFEKEQTSNNDIEIKLNENDNNLDTEKVKDEIKNGGIDYSNITSDYKIYHYSIVSSTKGCEFNLISEENIQDSNNEDIYLNFIETNADNNITAQCSLSNSNGNKIPCKLSKNIENTYILDPFIYSDNSEIITISQKNTSNYLPLKCAVNSNAPKFRINKKKRLSTGGILGIIFGIIGAIVLTVLGAFILSKSNKSIQQNVNYFESHSSLNTLKK